jgi:ketose-bisphosphate aldolase
MDYSPRDVLQKARDGGYAIGAFNAGNLETVKAIVQAAVSLKSPVIIESSMGETEYFGAKNLVDVVRNYEEEFEIPILINLDHAKNDSACKVGIDAGYDLVHIDASELEYEENVEVTRRVLEMVEKLKIKNQKLKVKDREILVEGEIDHIQGSSALHGEEVEVIQKQGNYTDPDQAADFVKRTGIDTLASFIGNVHGVYINPPRLDMERLKLIASKVNCFLSLHGGSGIPDDQVREVIAAGIVKVNVNTEMRIAFKASLLKSLQSSDELAIYKLTPPAIVAMQKVVEEKMRLFGSMGKA